ncbi:hypothetical protein ACTWPT_35940 [Nonomuraea sp. 3N208]|uniref:hypothetical protein n=1 Tax=Nonomuraea sp. 3N208 TaxID=3457421 RepID=UPI003FCF1417
MLMALLDVLGCTIEDLIEPVQNADGREAAETRLGTPTHGSVSAPSPRRGGSGRRPGAGRYRPRWRGRCST